MAVISLNGARRESLGKGGARKARRAGHIPGVLYGHGEEPIPVSVGAREFDLALRTLSRWEVFGKASWSFCAARRQPTLTP